MKKQNARKIQLNRETLQALSTSEIAQVQGAAVTVTLVAPCPNKPFSHTNCD
jgi:hypothetical protein